MDEKIKHTNRLINEDSPYLIQHAHNPVDWYPWCQEAFDLAESEDKPIFLSIGYATCHWCHVMERESFESDAVAEVLNEHFVSIKLDREQHPDIDDIYMTGVQLLTGQGGWPMSSFLMPDGKPFFAGTYYPQKDFLGLLQQISALWRSKKEEVAKQANEISDAIENYAQAKSKPVSLDQHISRRAAEELLSRHDGVYGGFGGAPKFPNESQLLLLLDVAHRFQNQEALDAVVFTLQKMGRGGIYDQIAGGFHRYTVDQNWLTPHFEKMLYNQAQLLEVFTRAYQLTGKLEFKQVIEETITYVLRDMTDPEAGFYSATDADSEGREGEFFVWTPEQLDEVLGDELAALARRIYRVSDEGNFEGKSILFRDRSWDEYAEAEGISQEELLAKNTKICDQLYQAREKREHPLRDEKIIVCWNAMMVNALVKAAGILNRREVLKTAEGVAEFLWNNCYNPKKGLWRIWMKGRVSIPASLEDYAALADTCLVLYRAGSESNWRNSGKWLDRASVLIEEMLEKFRDKEGGGFYTSQADRETPLITRAKSPMDGAMPSGNSMALCTLVELSNLVQDESLKLKIEPVITRMIESYSGLVNASPSAFSYMLISIQKRLTGFVDASQYSGSGHVRIEGRLSGDWVELEVQLDKGWHIYSGNQNNSQHAPLTSASLNIEDETVTIVETHYPEGQKLSTDFQDQPILVYKETVTLRMRVDQQRKFLPVSFRFQACSQELCLSETQIHLNLISNRTENSAPALQTKVFPKAG